MKCSSLLLTFSFLSFSLAVSEARDPLAITETAEITVNTTAEPVAAGKFAPTWQSLQQYQVPEWFRNAKFGIWAHWGPQCQPEQGDWYARAMYQEDSPDHKFHVEHYGAPSEFGFKDVIHTWKAENWDPAKLVALYKRTGAQYFFALANHHDNLDLWDSKYQPWNTTKVGPEKDILAGWAKAAHEQGLPFGLSVHAAHAWLWYEAAHGADKNGPQAGVPYDGNLTKADGKGKWWDGLDPQDLYEQRHAPSVNFEDPKQMSPRWNWGSGATHPDQAYCDKFYNRTVDMINKYHPDLIYFDDTGLPLWPVSDAGVKIAAHFYNTNMKLHDGKLEGVIFGKVLDAEQRKALVWDIERGTPNVLEPFAWQTDTCIGNWHYDRALYDNDRYKSAATVVRMLADIVSKNGNLLLNIPVRGDGTIDDKEIKVLEGIAAWMDVNKECIFDTRPWKIFGEGPASSGAPIKAQGFNEGKSKFSAEDVRFTSKGDTLYAITLGAPSKDVQIRALGTAAKLLDKPIGNVALLGSSEKLEWSQDDAGLTIKLPASKTSDAAAVFKITP